MKHKPHKVALNRSLFSHIICIHCILGLFRSSSGFQISCFLFDLYLAIKVTCCENKHISDQPVEYERRISWKLILTKLHDTRTEMKMKIKKILRQQTHSSYNSENSLLIMRSTKIRDLTPGGTHLMRSISHMKVTKIVQKHILWTLWVFWLPSYLR